MGTEMTMARYLVSTTHLWSDKQVFNRSHILTPAMQSL
jgi:hypothetical protein